MTKIADTVKQCHASTVIFLHSEKSPTFSHFWINIPTSRTIHNRMYFYSITYQIFEHKSYHKTLHYILNFQIFHDKLDQTCINFPHVIKARAGKAFVSQNQHGTDSR